MGGYFLRTVNDSSIKTKNELCTIRHFKGQNIFSCMTGIKRHCECVHRLKQSISPSKIRPFCTQQFIGFLQRRARQKKKIVPSSGCLICLSVSHLESCGFCFLCIYFHLSRRYPSSNDTFKRHLL